MNAINDSLKKKKKLTSTKAMLTDFSTQEDQTTTITNLRDEVAAALDDQDNATRTIQQLRAQITTQEATITALNTTVTTLTAAVTAAAVQEFIASLAGRYQELQDEPGATTSIALIAPSVLGR